jgi:hypothetical protein
MYYIKLSNGDDIVANISKNTKGDFTTLINPFKMDTRPMVTEEGVIDTLSLSSWLHPYSEDTSVRVAKSSIVTIVPASPGLKTFYEKQYNVFLRNKVKTPKEWKVKERKKPTPIQTQYDEYDEYMDEMDEAEWNKIKKRIYN